jgi:hypothetical protein
LAEKETFSIRADTVNVQWLGWMIGDAQFVVAPPPWPVFVRYFALILK